MLKTSDRQWANDIADKYESGEYGWTQGAFAVSVDSKACYCIMGAVRVASGLKYNSCDCGCDFLWEDLESDADFNLMTDRIVDLSAFLGDGIPASLADWNDMDTTSKEDVIAVLRRYANG